MTFFYDLNKKLDTIRAKPETTHQQLNERDMSRAAKGYEKYGKQGMEALAKAGREGKALDPVRKKYDKYDESVEEGLGSMVKKIGSGMKRAAGKAMDVIAPGDEALMKDLQKKVGVPQTGKPPAKTMAFHKSNTVDDNAVTAKVKEAGAPMSAKQKSFAALAEPKDKITFADKIAGAKKEVDEMLGDVAAEAMKSAIGATRKISGKRYGGALQKDDEPAKPAVPRGRGRPKKPTDTEQGAELKPDFSAFGVTGKAIKLPPHKGTVTRHKLSDKEPGDSTNEADDSQLKAAIKMLKKAGYRVEKAEEELEEKAVSKKQQRFMGMVHATQKGEKAPSKAVAKVAKEMPKKDAKDFAATKHKGLPEKVKGKKKEEVEETADQQAPKAKGGVQFGKGIYDSMNRELEQMIAESMNISMSMSTDAHGGPGKTLTVTATDQEAETLAQMLQQAGMGGDQHMEEAYGDVTATDNEPEYPTNTETSNDPFQYAGGINKPKSTGQTTVPVIASQQERQHTYAEAEEDALHRMMEMAGMNQHNRLDEQDIGKKIKLPAAQWLRDPRLETQVMSLKVTGINVTDPAKGFVGDDGNDREYPGKYSFLVSTTAKNPMYFKDFLNMVMKKNPSAEVVGIVQAEQPELAEELQRMRELAGLGEAAKPDYIDLDKDGNKKESMKKAAADKDKDKKVEESIFSLTNQWQQYKG